MRTQVGAAGPRPPRREGRRGSAVARSPAFRARRRRAGALRPRRRLGHGDARRGHGLGAGGLGGDPPRGAVLNVGAQCTAGFVLVDGGRVFLAEAAHCLSIGTPRGAEGDGCTSRSLPSAPRSTSPGPAQRDGGLQRLDRDAPRQGDQPRPLQPSTTSRSSPSTPATPRLVNPSVPVWGGPAALATTGITPGDAVYGFGNSELALRDPRARAPARGRASATPGTAGATTCSPPRRGPSATPGAPTSTSTARRSATLISIELSPVPGSNGIGDLARELAYLRRPLPAAPRPPRPGTEPFTGRR